MHVLSDANGLPLVIGVSVANTHGSQALKSMVAGLQSRHDPYRGWNYEHGKLHADKTYDVPELRKRLVADVSQFGSPARASSRANDSVAGAGSSSAPCPGSRATAASTTATSAIPATTSPSSASPQPSARYKRLIRLTT
jgi:hypothetical protein